MPAKEAVVTSTFTPDVETAVLQPYRATYPGPIELAIKRCQVLDKGGKPTRMVKAGEPFYLCMDVYYSELLGDLEADFIAEFHVMDLTSCSQVKAYCCSVEAKLKCDTTHTRICCRLHGSEKSVYTYTATIALPNSDLFDFCCFEECFAVAPTCHHERYAITAPAAHG